MKSTTKAQNIPYSFFAALVAVFVVSATFLSQAPAKNSVSADVVTIIESGFEGDQGDWGKHGGAEEKVAISDKAAHTGKSSLYSYDRSDTWHGPTLSVGSLVNKGEDYEYSVWVYYDQASATDTQLFGLCASYSLDGTTEYPTIEEKEIPKGEWTQFSGKYSFPAGSTGAIIYVQTGNYENPSAQDKTCPFYIDDFKIEGNEREIPKVDVIDGQVPLKDVFAKYGIKVGTALMDNDTNEGHEVEDPNVLALVKTHFNSVTPGNELKPQVILNQAKSQASGKPEVSLSGNWTSVKPIAQFCKDNGISMRGHVMVWHSQTDAWFFHEGFKADGADVSKAVMTERVNEYIDAVFKALIDAGYIDLFYAYDIVNEAFTDSGSSAMRDPAENGDNGGSHWMKTFGNDSFIDEAFKAARKAQAKYGLDNIKLFYNDYNEYLTGKRDAIYAKCKQLYDDGLLDGVGLQSHLEMQWVSVKEIYHDQYYTEPNMYKQAIEKIGSIGCEIQLTELDVRMKNQYANGQKPTAQDLEDQAQYYVDALNTILTAKAEGKANITAIIFWGVIDSNSWYKQYFPLLFDEKYQPKPAYNAIIDNFYDPTYVVPGNTTTTKPTTTKPATTTTKTTVTTTPSASASTSTTSNTASSRTTSGVIINPAATYGDIDENEKVNVADVVKLAKHFAGKDSLSSKQKENANAYLDDVLNVKDLQAIIKFIFGEIESLPVTQ